MSVESALPAGGDRTFGLIETFRWSRAGGYVLLANHLDRLTHSARALGLACDRTSIESSLLRHARCCDAEESRVRLVLSRDGTVAIAAAPLGEPTDAYRVAIATPRHPSSDLWLRHKTTLRDRYEQPLAAAVAAHGADEVLFLNERDELCEGARSNLFVRCDGRLATPPLSCGLLPGTLRAHLLHRGEAQEAVLHLDDLVDAEAWYLGNSVRGLVRATLLPPAHAG